MPSGDQLSDASIDAAALWLARRDRGLTAPEQDAYLEWLREDPLHGEIVVRLDKIWDKLNLLADSR